MEKVHESGTVKCDCHDRRTEKKDVTERTTDPRVNHFTKKDETNLKSEVSGIILSCVGRKSTDSAVCLYSNS